MQACRLLICLQRFVIIWRGSSRLSTSMSPPCVRGSTDHLALFPSNSLLFSSPLRYHSPPCTLSATLRPLRYSSSRHRPPTLVTLTAHVFCRGSFVCHQSVRLSASSLVFSPVRCAAGSTFAVNLLSNSTVMSTMFSQQARASPSARI